MKIKKDNRVQSTVLEVKVPRLKSTIKYFDPDTNQYREATVSRAGKATGKNQFWFNIQHDDDSTFKSINFEVVTNWENVEKEAALIAVSSVHSFDVQAAKLAELENWRDHGVFEECPDDGQSFVSVRWVITKKLKDGNSITKARLVARGFEEANLERIRKDSPTCTKDHLRLMLTIISTHDWQVNSLDVKSAFLQGDVIGRDVFLKPPAECKFDGLWKLKKTVYGLCDAPRAWYLRINHLLKVLHCESAFF